MGLLLQILGVINMVIPLMKDAEAAFSGKKGSGKKKKKLVQQGAKTLLANTDLTEAQKKAAMKEIGKTIDTVAAVAEVVNSK